MARRCPRADRPTTIRFGLVICLAAMTLSGAAEERAGRSR